MSKSIDIINIFESTRDNDGHIDTYDLPPDFQVVEEGDWIQEHKHQYSQDIVQHVPSGRFFSISQSRSGSHYSDWYYDASEVMEVRKVTETIVVTKWVDV